MCNQKRTSSSVKLTFTRFQKSKRRQLDIGNPPSLPSWLQRQIRSHFRVVLPSEFPILKLIKSFDLRRNAFHGYRQVQILHARWVWLESESSLTETDDLWSYAWSGDISRNRKLFTNIYRTIVASPRKISFWKFHQHHRGTNILKRKTFLQLFLFLFTNSFALLLRTCNTGYFDYFSHSWPFIKNIKSKKHRLPCVTVFIQQTNENSILCKKLKVIFISWKAYLKHKKL